MRAIQIQRRGRISSKRTKKTAAICEKVLALPKMLGLKFRRPAMANRHGAGSENGNVAAEHEHRKFPRNLVQY